MYFLAALGRRCCALAFSSCSERGLLLLRSTGSRRAGFSSCDSRALERRLSSCGTRAQLLCGMWDLPGPGLEPLSPALAGGFLTTAPPGKPLLKIFFFLMWTIFKVFTEFVTILLLFYVLVFWPRGTWDLSSPTRD